MADKEILDAEISKEVESLVILLTAKAARASITLEEYISIRRLQGASMKAIRADLLNDLETGGRIFGEFRRSIRATANGTIHRFRDVGEVSELGTERQYKWAAVFVNTCPDCIERHGKAQSWEDWERDGLPRTLQTICKEHCRCMLIPDSFSVLEPIQRGKRP